MTKKVGILFGGRSAEHEVSLQSAKNIFDAIDRTRYEPILIGIDKDGSWSLNEGSSFLLNADNPKLIALNKSGDLVALAPQHGGNLLNLTNSGRKTFIEVVFPVLHGPMGEDGTVQGLLKLAGIPFVGATVLGSAIGMDKDVMKRLLRDAGLPIAPFIVLTKPRPIPEYKEIISLLGEPFFIKPANMGSSIGVSKVHSESEYRPAIERSFKYDRKLIIEQEIVGREIECAVLGNEAPEASLPGEVLITDEFYSYESKYIDEKGSTLEIPARLSNEVVTQVQELAIRTFTTLECTGLGRVDFFLTEKDKLVINEINTIPGFTKISMYPKLWEASGISYMELINRLIELALERSRSEEQLHTRYL